MSTCEAFSDLSNKDAPVRGYLHPSSNSGANCLILTHGAGRDQEGLRAAVDAIRRLKPGGVFLGGHSYGGRQASVLAAAEPHLVEGLLLLSYPLHPPNKPAELRTTHFPSLQVPALFVHGTRDGFGTISGMQSALSLIPARTELLPIIGAGHELLTKSNRATLIAEVISRFMSGFADFTHATDR